MSLGRVGIVVAARSGSRRLPGKALLSLRGVPMLAFLLGRLKPAQRAALYLATTDLPADDVLEGIAVQAGVPVFRGADADVVARYVAAAERFSLDTVVRVTADCPFVDAEIVDFCLEQVERTEAFDLATTKTRFPTGLDCEIYKADSMAELHRDGRLDASEREHLTLHYYNHSERYRIQYIDPMASWRSAGRHLMVDTAADYAFATRLAASLPADDLSIGAVLRTAAAIHEDLNLTGRREDVVNRQTIDQALEDCLPAMAQLPTEGGGAYARVEAALDVLLALDRIFRNPNDDPYPVLAAALGRVKAMADAANIRAREMAPGESKESAAPDRQSVAQLYARAWTTYGESTYDHSVSLVEQRLRRSGLDEAFFRNKVCLDGGCGTGRASIAMAKAGARRVVAVDVSEASLEYLRRTAARYQLSNIEVVQQDVTDLGRFETGSFDFVFSNGVLHHTAAPERGLAEHFRIVRPGGKLWLYLYGAGGLYWDVYDRFRPIVTALDVDENYRILRELRVREGLIYTFLDNLRAPRQYYLLDQVLALLRQSGEFTHEHARGMSVIDDTQMLLASKWGSTILGPQGEVRIVATKR